MPIDAQVGRNRWKHVALVAVATGCLVSCRTTLRFSITSSPPNLPVLVCEKPTRQRTPADFDLYDSSLSWPRTVSVRRGDEVRTATLDTWNGGFKTGWTLIINAVENDDAAAWVLEGWNQIRVALPRPGKFLLTYDSTNRSESALKVNGAVVNRMSRADDSERQYRRIGIAELNSGDARIESSAFSMDVNIPELTRVSVAWYQAEPGLSGLAFKLDRTRFKSGELVMDDHPPVDLTRIAGTPVFTGSKFRIKLRDAEGRSYQMTMQVRDFMGVTLGVARD